MLGSIIVAAAHTRPFPDLIYLRPPPPNKRGERRQTDTQNVTNLQVDMTPNTNLKLKRCSAWWKEEDKPILSCIIIVIVMFIREGRMKRQPLVPSI